LFVSCNHDAAGSVADGGSYDLKVVLYSDANTKALGTDSVYTTGMTVASYEYRATCTTTAGAQGTQGDWTALTVTGTSATTNASGGAVGSATLVKLDRGSWTIDVRAKNSEGGVILQGQNTVVLTTNGQDMAITLNNNVTHFSTTTNGAAAAAANVNVSVGVTVPKLASGAISVKYVALSNVGTLAADGSAGTAVTMTAADGFSTSIDGAGIAHSTEAAGKVGYYGTVALAPGLYAMQILYKDGSTVVSGQTIAFRVVEKAPFAINGTLTAGEFLNLDITPITEDSRYITVAWDTANEGTPAAAAGIIGAKVLASSVQGELGTCTYTWFIDGVLETNAATAEAIAAGRLTSTRTFSAGTHVVTCVVSATIGGYASVGYISSEVTIAP